MDEGGKEGERKRKKRGGDVGKEIRRGGREEGE